MKVVPKKEPAAYVEPHLTDARLGRMWTHIDARLHGRRSRAKWLMPAFAAAALVTSLLLLFLRPAAIENAAAPKPASVVASDDVDRIVDFASGSSIALHPHTQLVMLAVSETAVRVRLERGSIACTVRLGAPAATFTVEAGAATAAFQPGTYEVTQDSGQEHSVQVEAYDGTATVHAADGSVVALLQPGEHWSDLGVAKAAGWVSQSPSAVPPAPAAESPSKANPQRPDAGHIFARGERARLEGKSDEAAKAFDELYRAFPADRRAPIAALEAGRLHLHGIGSLHEAIAALTFAHAHAQEPFREDAHSGLVEGLARAGQLQACKNQREGFLAAYPASPHREKVAAQCP